MKYLALLSTVISAFIFSAVSQASVPIELATSFHFLADGALRADLYVEKYPDPKPGYKIVVIRPGFDIKNIDKNDGKKIQLILTEPLKMDPHNSVVIHAELKVNDWPRYYELNLLNIGSTMIGSFGGEETPLVSRPVAINTGIEFLRYEYATVLYVPEDVTVKYVIWERGSQENDAATR